MGLWFARCFIATILVAFSACLISPAVADPPVVRESTLDILHADVTAKLVGCDPKSGDRVLVNGRPQDGVLWALVGMSPAAELPMDPIFRTELAKLKQPAPTSYPELHVHLKPGYYGALSISVGDCSFGSIPLTAPESSDRNIVLVREPNAALPPTSLGFAGVYANAPLPGLQISLSGGTPEQTLVARNEVSLNPFIGPHGALYGYFFDAVHPGRYTMTVSGFGWTKKLGEVVVSDPGELVLRYIPNSELGIP